MEAERKTNSRRIISLEPLLRALALFYAPYAVCLAIVGCCIALEGFGADAMSGMIALFSNDAPFPFLWLLFAAEFFCAACCARGKTSASVRAAASLGTLAVAAGGYYLPAVLGQKLPQTPQAVSILTFALLLLAFAALCPKGEAGARFGVRLVWAGFLGALVSTALFLGTIALFFAFGALLSQGSDSPFRFTGTAAALYYGALLPLLILPKLTPDEPMRESLPRAANAFVRFGVLPLLCALTLIFYGYLLRILGTGIWPSNEVAPLVLFASAAVACVLFFFGSGREDRAAKGFFRAAPPIWLLPLSMLFFACFIRIRAYGATPQRLLAVLFGLWMLGALVYAFFFGETFSARALPLSLGIALIAAALLPFLNVFTLCRLSQTARLDRALAEAEMGSHECVVPNPGATDEQKETIMSAARYLLTQTNVGIVLESGEILTDDPWNAFGFSNDVTGETPSGERVDDWVNETTRVLAREDDAIDTTGSRFLLPDFFYDPSDAAGQEMSSVNVWARTFPGELAVEADEGTASFDLDAAIQSAAERYDAGDENWATAELEENGIRVRIIFDAIVLEENGEQSDVQSASFAVLLLENGGETAKNPPSLKK